MKKILLNSTVLAGLVAAAVSLWIVVNPVSVYAGSAWATCKFDETVTCSAPNSQCIGIDSTDSSSGYCRCNSLEDGSVTAFKFCIDIGPPPILD